MSPDNKGIVSNEINILLSQLEQVTSLISSQTRDMGGFDANIRSIEKRLTSISGDIEQLFSSRNELRSKLEKMDIDQKNDKRSVFEHMNKENERVNTVSGFNERLTSIEGYIKSDLEEKKQKEIDEKEARSNKRSKIFTISWDIVKIIINMAIAIGAAYLTVRWASGR